MKRHGRILIAALALFVAPISANAQTVFFDDFDGNALLPHWNQPPASDWEYNVSNGMLNVTSLLYPSNPKSSGNFTSMNAGYAPQADFQMDVWMGWEAGQSPHRLSFYVGGPFSGNPVIAQFGYGDGLVFAGPGDAPPIGMAAPAPGIHHFTINRTGTQLSFYLNGSPFASFQDNFGFAAAAVWFNFVGPYPGTLGAFHIDRVVVVPAPGATILVAAGLSFNRRRALRRN